MPIFKGGQWGTQYKDKGVKIKGIEPDYKQWLSWSVLENKRSTGIKSTNST